MAAIERRAVEAFLRRPDPRAATILLYGPDSGLVSERAKGLLALSVDDASDPFQAVRLDGDDIAADPPRLADEALTVPLFGGRRAILVRAGARSIASAVEPLLDEPPRDCRIIIEGGDWKKSHALVTLLTRARSAAVIACYGDETANLDQLIAEEAAAAGLSVTPEAREALLSLLGGDRLASRGELQKLTLYAAGAGRIELSDVEAVVGDASAFAQDRIIDAAFEGRTGDLDAGLQRAFLERIHPSVIAGAALRQALTLHRLRAEVDKGRPAAALVQHPASGIPRMRQASVTAQLQALPLDRLSRIVADLQDTVLDARRQHGMAETLVARALMRLALTTSRRR
jgi:DNA polymerase-3 subunit delta